MNKLKYRFYDLVFLQSIPYLIYFIVISIRYGHLQWGEWLCIWGTIVFNVCGFIDNRNKKQQKKESPYTLHIGYIIYCAGILINDNIYKIGIGFISFTVYSGMEGFLITIAMFIAAIFVFFRIVMIHNRNK